MLLFRSILQICALVCLTTPGLSQYYSPDYRVSDDLNDPDHAGYRSSGGDSSAEVSSDDRPDYSKYYKSEGSSAALLGAGAPGGFLQEGKEDQGFVTPLDFSGFFSAGQFGAASNQQQSLPTIAVQNPFHYAEALKKQNSSGFVDASDFSGNFANAPSFELDIGKQFSENPFEPKGDNTYVAPKKEYKNYPKKTQSYKSEVDDLNGYEKPQKKFSKYEKKNSYNINIPPVNYAPIVPTLSSYTGGKINHLAPVKTYVPQLFPASSKHTNVPLNIQSTLAPNYNLNLPPLDSLKSTLPPLNNLNNYNIPSTNNYDYISPTEFAQPSEKKFEKVQNSNCQQIAKQLSPDDISHGRFRRQADKMNCYLCKDPKSGGTYEQCSYTSDPENDGSYFRGHAEKYSTKTYVDPEDHSRNRRDTKRERRNKKKRNDKEEEYVNPFNYEKKNSHKFNSKPTEFDDTESYYQAPDFSHYEKDSENYRFGPEYFTDSTKNEKSYSEVQSEELKKGDNCKKIKKDSMTCMICSNPKTGGNYEQCSYTSEPKENKYSYVKEKKYNSNDDPEEKTVESTETKPTIQRNKSQKQKPIEYSAKHPKQLSDDKDDYYIRNKSRLQKQKPIEYSASTKHPKQLSDDKDDYYIPHDYISESKQKKRYETADGEDKNKHGDYVYKLFPEYAEKESKNREVKQRPGFEYKSELPEYFTAEESKKDVDSVLQEFSKKDRSKCKKIAKDKMTCYICLDDKGVQHEECMFVSESQPKSSHIAYHEVKEFSSDPKRPNEEETADTKQEITSVPLKQRKSKKSTSQPIKEIKDVEPEPTEYVKVVGKTPRIVRRKTNLPKEYLGSQAEESKTSEVKVQPDTKQDVQEEEIPEGPEGQFASELVPTYSKELGVTLPKFMLDISEGEQIYDQVVKSG